MANILSDFGINLLEEEVDDVIFQTNEFLCDATFTGQSGPFWFLLQMSMALAALFSLILATNLAYKMMVKHEPLDVMKLFKPLAVAVIMCWWYPPADTGMTNSHSSWCFLDFLAYIPNAIGSYTHDLYQAEATQLEDKFEQVQELIHTRDTIYTNLQAKADVAHTGTSDSSLKEATMESAGVEQVTQMEEDASKLWFTSLTSGVVVCLDKFIMTLSMIIFRVGWWSTLFVQQILLGMLTIFGPIQWAFSLLPKWEGAWAKWITRYLTVHFYGCCLFFVSLRKFITYCISICFCCGFRQAQQACNKNIENCCAVFCRLSRHITLIVARVYEVLTAKVHKFRLNLSIQIDILHLYQIRGSYARLCWFRV